MSVILETINLKKYFGEVRAVDNVNLKVERGEFVFIIGPNGAGKTTLVNLISRWLKEDSGRIKFMNQDITPLDCVEVSRLGIVRSFQLVNIFDNLTVLDNVRICILSRMGRSKRILSLLDRDKEVLEEALNILERFDLLDKKDFLASELPHGDRKLLDVAMSFSLKPKLLLLDEPTSGVSTADKRVIMDYIRKVAKEEDITTIIVEHDMDIVFGYSERVLVMHEGKIIADGPPEEIRNDENVKRIMTRV